MLEPFLSTAQVYEGLLRQPPATHPEQLDTEVFIANEEPFSGCGWKSVRYGVTAYMATGEAIPERVGLRPMFVQRSEIQEALDQERARVRS